SRSSRWSLIISAPSSCCTLMTARHIDLPRRRARQPRNAITSPASISFPTSRGPHWRLRSSASAPTSSPLSRSDLRMSDAESFGRFIEAMQALLSAIESRCAEVTRAEATAERLLALREITRLAQAVADLAQAFDVDDVRSLALALAGSTSGAVADAE